MYNAVRAHPFDEGSPKVFFLLSRSLSTSPPCTYTKTKTQRRLRESGKVSLFFFIKKHFLLIKNIFKISFPSFSSDHNVCPTATLAGLQQKETRSLTSELGTFSLLLIRCCCCSVCGSFCLPFFSWAAQGRRFWWWSHCVCFNYSIFCLFNVLFDVVADLLLGA